MEKVLGQGEIDALFATARANAAAQSGGGAAVDSHELYNFSRAGQISNEQMKAISTLNDLFARNLMHTMAPWLRTEFVVALVSGEQMPFAEFVERVEEKTYICSVRLEPLGAIGLLDLELRLAPPIIDLLLGGTGRVTHARGLTAIEELIMESVIKMIVKELNVAWQPVGLVFNLEKRESGSHVARIMPGGEKTMCVSFEVRMPETSGALTLCLPAVVLNTILRKLIADRDRPRRRSNEIRQRVRDLVGASKIGTTLQFPPVRLQARQIAMLHEGMVLRLPVPRHAVAELCAGGMSLGRARPVRMGEHRGARMEDLGAESNARSERPLGASASPVPEAAHAG